MMMMMMMMMMMIVMMMMMMMKYENGVHVAAVGPDDRSAIGS